MPVVPGNTRVTRGGSVVTRGNDFLTSSDPASVPKLSPKTVNPPNRTGPARGRRRERGATDAQLAQLSQLLAKEWQGELLSPGDRNFRRVSRIWNAAAQQEPGLIARCRDTGDVRQLVAAAARAGILTAIRCGGHSLAGYGSCAGGLVVDLSLMREVVVTAGERQARFQGGALLGTVDEATQRGGLAFPAGVVSHTGAGGLVLGGGTGWLSRLFGLSCDNVLGFELVTAGGDCLQVTERKHPELFWALRGGGGNFGVVTEFTVRLHRLTSVLLATSYCFGDDIPRVISLWRQFMPNAPEALKLNLSLRLAPGAGTTLPRRFQKQPALSIAAAWFGEAAEGRRIMQHIFSVGRHLDPAQHTVSFVALQTMADADFPAGRRYYTKSGYFLEMSDAAMETMIGSLATVPSPRTQIELSYLGGAASRVGAAETAFGERRAPFIVNLLADWRWAADDAVNTGWVRELFNRLRPAMAPGVYVNFMSGDEDQRVIEAYHDRWDRLVAVKSRYDPANFFRRNQNIRPLQAGQSKA